MLLKISVIISGLFSVIILSCQIREPNNTLKEENLTVEEKVKLATLYRLGSIDVEKNETKSFFLFKEAAIQGNAEAQTNLAWMYQTGIGVKPDKQLAIYWYTQSANQGNALSKYNLGYVYLFDKNYLEALHWFEEASKQGFIPAWNDLGAFYLQGWGVDKNPTIAIQYFKMGAKYGDNNAQINLALLYYEGIDIPRDNIQAYAWFKIANCASDIDSTCLEQVNRLIDKMSEEQLELADHFAIKIINELNRRDQ